MNIKQMRLLVACRALQKVWRTNANMYMYMYAQMHRYEQKASYIGMLPNRALQRVWRTMAPSPGWQPSPSALTLSASSVPWNEWMFAPT